VETFDQADSGYPEEGPPGADPTDEGGEGESAVREKSRPGGAEQSGAPDNDDGKATGNPKT
jgi:hypothetical protein